MLSVLNRESSSSKAEAVELPVFVALLLFWRFISFNVLFSIKSIIVIYACPEKYVVYPFLEYG